MKLFAKVIAIAGLTFVSAGLQGATAHAQNGTLPVQKPFRIKVGGSFGNGNVNVKNFGDVAKIDYRFNVGLAYEFSKTTATNPVIFNVYADYFRGTDENKVAGTSFDLTGTTYAIGVAGRYLFAPAVGTSGQPYGELGLGYYSTKLDTGNNDYTQGTLGGKVALGYQLNMGLFGEVEYTIVDTISKDGVEYKPSSIRASVGYRF